MMTKSERLVLALALAVTVANFLFTGMGVLYYMSLLVILVIGIIGLVRERRKLLMTIGRSFWFTITALCVTGAVLILGGRTMIIDHVGDLLYRSIIITAYALLAGAAGSLTTAFSLGHDKS